MLKVKSYRLFIYITILSIFGIVMIYSASNYSAALNQNDAFYFVKKQSFSFVIALIGFFIAKYISIDSLKQSSKLFYILSIILLLIVFIPKVGVENYGAKRWINLYFTTFQPSEIAKFSLVICIAKILENNSANNFKTIFQILSLSLFVVLLILIEPNMSIAITVTLVVILMLLVGGIKVYQMLILLVPLVVAFIALILLEPYRLARLSAFIDPFATPLNEGYQLIQSYYALAGGGVFGVGLFNSIQKYLFLPFSESDFIFSIIGEELGLIGASVVIILFLLAIYEAMKIAINAKDRFSTYLAFGISAVLMVQVVLNLCVVTGSVPPTGLPLPFVSFGGSSLIVFFFFMGILENIATKSLCDTSLNRIY